MTLLRDHGIGKARSPNFEPNRGERTHCQREFPGNLSFGRMDTVTSYPSLR